MNLTRNMCSGSAGKWKLKSNNSAVRLLAAYGNKNFIFPVLSAAHCVAHPFGYARGPSPAQGERAGCC